MSAAIPYFDADEVEKSTPWKALIDAIIAELRSGCVSPVRQQHEVGPVEGPRVSLLLMPAWSPDGLTGIKLSTVAPDNARLGLPSVNGLYVLLSGRTGMPQAILDAGALTARRTAAASALACDRLARADASTLLVVGTGRIARHLASAHAAVRDLSKIMVWGRSPQKAQAMAHDLASQLGVLSIPVPELRDGVEQADIISTATFSTEPLVLGHWLRPGTHLDLVGAFTPGMRETDADTIRRADRVFVDSLDAARGEAGDLILAEREGAFSFAGVSGELADLAATTGAVGRASLGVSVYKSVGTAVLDLAAARLCMSAGAHGVF